MVLWMSSLNHLQVALTTGYSSYTFHCSISLQGKVGTVNLNPQRICTSNHFSSSDKKFVIKARLSGTLPVIAAFLKRSYNDPSSLPVILSMVKTLAVNGNHVFPQLFCSHKL